MLRKLNTTLLIIFIVGLLIDGGYWAYTTYADKVADSGIVHQLGGE